MKYILRGIFLCIITACASKKVVTNGLLHNVTLSSLDKSTASYYSTANYSFPLNSIKAVDAWNYIRYNITSNNPGEGMKILVIDSAVAPDHVAFYNSSTGINRISQILVMDTFSGDVTLDNNSTVYTTNTNYNELTSVSTMSAARSGGSNLSELINASQHGAGVASVAAGNQYATSGTTYAGVAWGAQVGVIQIAQNRSIANDYSGDGKNTDGLSALYGKSSTLSNIIKTNGYHIVNMSFGDGDISNSEANSLSTAVKENNVLFVVSTGNNETGDYTNPQYPARYAKDFNQSSYSGGFLAVGSANNTTHASTENFNYCGDAKAYCLVAPSSNVNVARSTSTTTYAVQSGTSFAAPQVAGAAAVIGGAFPSLTMREIRDFLLRGASPMYDTHISSTDASAGRRQQGGKYITSETFRTTAKDGVISDVYGYGMLDLLASVKLVDSTIVKNTRSTVKDSVIYVSSITAGMVNNALAFNQVQSFDEYGTYTIGLANNVKTLPSFGISDRISTLVRMNSMQNSKFVNMGNFGGFGILNTIAQKELSYTNHDVLQTTHSMYGLEQSGQFNKPMLQIQQQLAGFVFGFKDGYNPQNLAVVSNLENFKPFYSFAFSGSNAKQITMGSRFGNLTLNIESTFGKGQAMQERLDLFAQSSPNIAHAISIEHIKNNNKFNVDLGVLRESTTLLGAYSSGAFTLGRNNTTTFIKTKVEQNIFGSTSFIGAFALGKTNVGEQSSLSLFNNFSPIVSRSFVIGVKSRAFSGGNFELTYSQPLAIISGSLAFDSANGTQKISLIPTKQEQNYGISFTKETKKTRTSIQAAYILNQNNLNVKPTFGMFGTVSRAL